MLKLHYSPGTVSIAVAIALEEAGVAYQPVRVDFKAGEQTQAAYHKLNPKGRVPALETPDGVLTETGAILEFVAPGLVPADPYAAARMRELMYYLASTMHVNHAHRVRGHRWADQAESLADMQQKVPQTMAACCAYLEELLPQLPFELGAGKVVSDGYLFIVLSWLKGDGVDIADYPALQRFQQKMEARISVQTVRAKGLL